MNKTLVLLAGQNSQDLPKSCPTRLYRETLHIAIFGECSLYNDLRFYSNPLTAAAGNQWHADADALYGVNAAAERTGKAETAAICHYFSACAHNDRHPCRINTALMASVASPIIAVVNGTVNLHISLYYTSWSKSSAGRLGVVWSVQPWVGVIGLKWQIANLSFHKLANEAKRKIK